MKATFLAIGHVDVFVVGSDCALFFDEVGVKDFGAGGKIVDVVAERWTENVMNVFLCTWQAMETDDPDVDHVEGFDKRDVAGNAGEVVTATADEVVTVSAGEVVIASVGGEVIASAVPVVLATCAVAWAAIDVQVNLNLNYSSSVVGVCASDVRMKFQDV